MKVSVAVTTYNGERYIIKQLESLNNQIRKPDEVIIQDDRSTDNTVQVVQEYISKHNLQETWRVEINDENLGFKRNFLSCMKKTCGDIIFMCDQDDIWLPEKIKVMLDAFLNNSKISALICKENRIDENDSYIRVTKKETGAVRRISFDSEVRNCLGAGHLLGIQREIFEQYYDKLIENELTFDVPFCLLAASVGELYQIDRRLVDRRIHRSNTSGIEASKKRLLRNKELYIKGRRTRLQYFKFVSSSLDPQNTYVNTSEFENALSILENSISALEKRRFMALISELFTTNKYINKKISLANFLVLIKNRD